MLVVLFCVLAVLLVVACALPATDFRHWIVRAQDFPRAQYTVLLIVLLGVLVTWQWWGGAPSLWWAVPLLAALAYQIYWFWPYTALHKTEVPLADNEDVDAGIRLRVLTSNVLMTNRDASRLIAGIEQLQPDVIVTLETDQWWQEQLDAALTAWPHRVACPLDNLYGMHVYSRLPIEDARTSFLVDAGVPSIVARLQVAEDTFVRFHAVHPAPPAPGENERSTERDVELLMVADTVAQQDGPVIVTGDLNDVAWSRTTRLFCNVSGLLDPRIGRGLINTFHAQYWLCRWPLDHVFLSDHFRLRELKRLPDIGSDHFPVFADLVLGASRDVEPKERITGVDRELERDTRATDVAAQAKSPPLLG